MTGDRHDRARRPVRVHRGFPTHEHNGSPPNSASDADASTRHRSPGRCALSGAWVCLPLAGFPLPPRGVPAARNPAPGRVPGRRPRFRAGSPVTAMAEAPRPGERQLSAVLGEFARTMVTDFPIEAILDHLVVRIVEILPISAAGVTLIDAAADPRYIAASDGSALRFEKLQTELGEGPCLLAYRSGEAVQVPDLRAETRFPRFAPRAHRRRNDGGVHLPAVPR